MKFIGQIDGCVQTGLMKGNAYQLEVAETGLKSNLYVDNKAIPLLSAHARFHYIEPSTLTFISEEGGEEARCSVDNVDLNMSKIKLSMSQHGLGRTLMFEDKFLISVEKVDLFIDDAGDSYATLKVLLKAEE